MVINTGKKHSWDSAINHVTLSYIVQNTSRCVNCNVSGDNQLADSADWDEPFNDSSGDYIHTIFRACLGCLIEKITAKKPLVTDVGIVS